MPATMTRGLGKTGFVKEFLNDHPEANTRAVNEAWAAEGFEGTISPTLVTKIRSGMGLTGHIRKGPGKPAEAEIGTPSAPAIKKAGRPQGPTGRGGNQGKTKFVTEHLHRDPGSTDDEISEAWASAGNEGGISGSLISKIRAKEGLTGRREAKGRGAGKERRAQSPPKAATADRTPGPAAETSRLLDRRTNRGRIIEEVEGDIDHLIFKLMGVGGLEMIEEGLRRVRRRLILSQGR